MGLTKIYFRPLAFSFFLEIILWAVAGSEVFCYSTTTVCKAAETTIFFLFSLILDLQPTEQIVLTPYISLLNKPHWLHPCKMTWHMAST